MKHHEYSIYIGGFKIKLKGLKYCKKCMDFVKPNHHPEYKSRFTKLNRKNSDIILKKTVQQSSNPIRKGHSPI